MIKYRIFKILFLSIVSFVSAQKTASDYKYVVVPENYNFVKGNDTYNLNSLSKFILNKHGFNAFFQHELPKSALRCEGLYTIVSKESSILSTKIRVSLEDCNGNQVGKVYEGSSRLKAYNKAYPQALRNAFEQFYSAKVRQSSLAQEVLPIEKENTLSSTKSISSIAAANSNTILKESNTKVLDFLADATSYSNNGVVYMLERKENTHTYLLKEVKGDTSKLRGTLLYKKENVFEYVDTSGNTYKSIISKKGDLIIETSFQKLLFKKIN